MFDDAVNKRMPLKLSERATPNHVTIESKNAVFIPVSRKHI
jgi:hypothetical protein